jgi:hypothetical protein
MKQLVLILWIITSSAVLAGDPSNCLSMRLDSSILLNGTYRDPNWRPDPALKVGDHVPHEINGVRFEFIVIRVFWDGKEWKYMTTPDNGISI